MKRVEQPEIPSIVGGKPGRYSSKKYFERVAFGVGPQRRIPMHSERYDFVHRRGFANGKKVLDVCCGTGYGSEILSKSASSVLGVDISQEAVSFARKNHSNDKIKFVRMDAHDLKLPDGSKDLVTAFEALEHVSDPDRMLSEIKRVLKKGGYFRSKPLSREPFRFQAVQPLPRKRIHAGRIQENAAKAFRNRRFVRAGHRVGMGMATDGEGKVLVVPCGNVRLAPENTNCRKENAFGNSGGRA